MKIKTGDCVQLKTGGCLMAVREYEANFDNLPDAVICNWFNDAGEFCQHSFKINSLRQWVLAETENET